MKAKQRILIMGDERVPCRWETRTFILHFDAVLEPKNYSKTKDTMDARKPDTIHNNRVFHLVGLA